MAIGGSAPTGGGDEKDKKKDGIQELKDQLNEVALKIKKVLNGRNDRDQLSQEDKNQLRDLYTKAVSIARQLRDRIQDDAEREKYKKFYENAVEKAKSYGSSIKNDGEIPKTTMDDVKGLDNVKSLVKSFIHQMEHPEIKNFYHLEGGYGMLMHGAPGTGKTMIVEAIANAMKKPLFTISPSDIFKSYVGQSEQAVKQIFEDMDACGDGAILFVDECDTILSKRGANTQDYKAAVTNELLQRINGLGVNGSKRVLIAATNCPQNIDPAYLRHKRFSHVVHVTPPDEQAIRAILKSKVKDRNNPDNTILEDGFTLDMLIDMLKEKCNGPVDFSLDSPAKPKGKSYYSSADICGIYESACGLAIEYIVNNNITEPVKLRREWFVEAIKRTPPSISGELSDFHENFRERASKGEL